VRYVVAYDIEEDRARVRIAGVLERFGVRVQKSVFPSVASRRGISSASWAVSNESRPP
jgi:CRISPR-associated endonuclease Cas2